MSKGADDILPTLMPVKMEVDAVSGCVASPTGRARSKTGAELESVGPENFTIISALSRVLAGT